MDILSSLAMDYSANLAGLQSDHYEIWQIARKRMATGIIFNISLAVFIMGTIASFVIMSPLGTNLVMIGLSK